MDVLIFIAVALILFGAGYAFRGAIGREVKVLGAELVADRTKLVADLKAEYSAGVADLKAEYAKVIADATAAVTAVDKKI
jgi:hypothetical protein